MSSLLTPHVPQMLMANIATSMWHDSESLLAPYQTGVRRRRSYCRFVRERCFLLRRTHTGPRGGFVLHVFYSRSQTITAHLNHGLILDILQRDPRFSQDPHQAVLQAFKPTFFGHLSEGLPLSVLINNFARKLQFRADLGMGLPTMVGDCTKHQ